MLIRSVQFAIVQRSSVFSYLEIPMRGATRVPDAAGHHDHGEEASKRGHGHLGAAAEGLRGLHDRGVRGGALP